MKNMRVFRYLGSMLSKDGTLDVEVREKEQQGKNAAGSLKTVNKNREVIMDVKRSLQDSILIPTLMHVMYGSEA